MRHGTSDVGSRGSTKREMYENFAKGLDSEDMEFQSDMYYAMYAYEQCGDATRDNTFSQLVSLGKDLEENGDE